jgi:hypothetical protein
VRQLRRLSKIAAAEVTRSVILKVVRDLKDFSGQ